MSDALLDALAAIIGAEHVLTDADLRAGYETDWTGAFHGTALAVVRPADTEQVAAVLRAAAEHEVSVCTQGGNTGLVGGSVPRGGELLVSTRRLSELGEVDPAASELVAGAGATIAAVQGAARAAGRDFAVDFGARDSATIGGAIATNAGGSRVVRFGTMRAQVLGIEAVLADGRVLDALGALPKSTLGPHLPSLFAGSEGTLGVITAARLRLVPLLPQRAGAWVRVPDVPAALALLGELRSLESLDSVEIVFASVIDAVHTEFGLAPLTRVEAGAVVLAECAANHDPTDELAGAIDRALRGPLAGRGVGEADSALLDARGCRRMEELRDHCSMAIARRGTPLKLDVAVGLDRLAELVDTAARAAARWPGVALYPFGHLAEGNLHLNLVGTDERSRAALSEEILGWVVSAGGTVSAEHGVGRAKVAWAARARGTAANAALAALRDALDPHRRLNPGVLCADP